MKVFRDLTVSGSPDRLSRFLSSLESSLADGWVRSIDLEQRVSAGPARCFVCPAGAELSAGAVWFAQRDDSTWYVSNIVPQTAGSLTYDEYNAILQAFYDKFVVPAATELTVEFTQAEQNLRNWMSPEAAEALERFSAAANKSSGSSHPADRERWLAFLLRIHRDRRWPDPTDLRRWLTEEEGWTEDAAFELIVEYEFSQDLLRFSESH